MLNYRADIYLGVRRNGLFYEKPNRNFHHFRSFSRYYFRRYCEYISCNQIHFLQLFIVFLNFIFSIFVYFLYCIIFYIVIVVLFMFMFMQITYNATLLQYGQFERILSRVTTSSVTIDSVQETLSRPTHEPTGMPTFQPSLSPTLNISNYVSSDTKGSAYYARRIVPLCVMGFCKCFNVFFCCGYDFPDYCVLIIVFPSCNDRFSQLLLWLALCYYLLNLRRSLQILPGNLKEKKWLKNKPRWGC